jgi:hypothetical protein
VVVAPAGCIDYFTVAFFLRTAVCALDRYVIEVVDVIATAELALRNEVPVSTSVRWFSTRPVVWQLEDVSRELKIGHLKCDNGSASEQLDAESILSRH